eukprot:m.19195 g.19195  ORF g.19195 m.19195 type:complete len:230 (-) comp12371_c0_seq1:224-913(-)
MTTTVNAATTMVNQQLSRLNQGNTFDDNSANAYSALVYALFAVVVVGAVAIAAVKWRKQKDAKVKQFTGSPVPPPDSPCSIESNYELIGDRSPTYGNEPRTSGNTPGIVSTRRAPMPLPRAVVTESTIGSKSPPDNRKKGTNTNTNHQRPFEPTGDVDDDMVSDEHYSHVFGHICANDPGRTFIYDTNNQEEIRTQTGQDPAVSFANPMYSHSMLLKDERNENGIESAV